jgi:hypothetical protein
MKRLLLLALVGCGGATSSTTTTTQTSSFCCSINRVSYDCPDSAAVDRCANLDNPDPSSCTRRSSACP